MQRWKNSTGKHLPCGEQSCRNSDLHQLILRLTRTLDHHQTRDFRVVRNAFPYGSPKHKSIDRYWIWASWFRSRYWFGQTYKFSVSHPWWDLEMCNSQVTYLMRLQKATRWSVCLTNFHVNYGTTNGTANNKVWWCKCCFRNSLHVIYICIFQWFIYRGRKDNIWEKIIFPVCELLLTNALEMLIT